MRKIVICASSARADQQALAKLLGQLVGAERRGDISTWDRNKIPGGTPIVPSVVQAMETADVIVLLISADLQRERDDDVKLAFQQLPRGARIIPVLIRATFVSGAEYDGLQLLPEKGPISAASDPDEEWVKVAQAVVMAGPAPARGPGPPDEPGRPPPRPRLSRLKMLFLGADPSDASTPLELPREVKAIRASIGAQQKLDCFDFQQELMTTRRELIQLLIREKPNVLHFSGHGTRPGQIVLLDDRGIGAVVRAEVLTTIFRTCQSADGFDIRCVVLSTCYSRPQAEAIAAHVPCVVGIDGVIPVDAAREFAAMFYGAAAAGQNVRSACDFGCLQAGLESAAGAGAGDGIQLFTRSGIDPRTYKLLG